MIHKSDKRNRSFIFLEEKYVFSVLKCNFALLTGGLDKLTEKNRRKNMISIQQKWEKPSQVLLRCTASEQLQQTLGYDCGSENHAGPELFLSLLALYICGKSCAAGLLV